MDETLTRRIRTCYQSLDADAVRGGALRSLYAPDVVFVDPFHRIDGLEAIEAYFSALYRNLDRIAFDYGDCLTGEDAIMMRWVMTLTHPRLNRRQPVSVPGVTHFSVTPGGLIGEHRDFFDGGAMLYENLPLLGTVIRQIKRRMGQ